MTNKMMRIAGRSNEGLAKGISTNNSGQVDIVNGTQVISNVLGADKPLPPKTKVVYQDVAYIGNADELFILATPSKAFGCKIIVEEVIGESTNSYTLETHTSDVFSGRNEYIVKNIKAPYIRVSVESISENDFNIGLYITAKTSNEVDVSGQIDIVNGTQVISEILGANKPLPSKTKVVYQDVTYIGSADEIFILATPSKAYGCKIIVEEVIGTPTNSYTLETHTSDVFSGRNEYIVKNIKAPYIRVSVESVSGNDFNIGLYITAKTTNEVDTSTPVELINGLSNITESLDKIFNNSRIVEEPPVLSNVNVATSTVAYVQDFRDGLFYGSRTNVIYTSPDGEIWTELATIPTDPVKSRTVEHIITTDTGRVVVTCRDGDIFVSDENGEFNTTPTIESGGTFNHSWGSTRQGNVIAMSTYDSHGGAGAYKAYISLDNGATFNEIMNKATLLSTVTMDDNRYHLHDIEYDPYSRRLFIWVGDLTNVALMQSDDFGATWQLTFKPEDTENSNSTQLVANPYGLALGADTYGGGVGFIHIDRTKVINPEINHDTDYDIAHWRFNDSQNRYITGKKWIERENNFYLLPGRAEYNDTEYGYLAYSKNGRDWQIIHNTKGKGSYIGLETIVHGNGRIVGTWNTSEGSKEIFVADIRTKV